MGMVGGEIVGVVTLRVVVGVEIVGVVTIRVMVGVEILVRRIILKGKEVADV